MLYLKDQQERRNLILEKTEIPLLRISVKNMAGSVSYYSQVFQLKQQPEEHHTVLFKFNNFNLQLYGEQNMMYENIRRKNYFNQILLLHVSTELEINGIFSRLKKEHNAILKEPSWHNKVYKGFCTDPDNHIWEVIYDPAVEQYQHERLYRSGIKKLVQEIS